MDNLQWRFKARVVACFNLFFSIVSVLVAVLLTVLAVDAIWDAPNDSAFWGPLVIIAVILDITIVIQLWAALKLLSATEKGKPADEALKNSRIWLTVNINFLVISVVFNILSLVMSITAGESNMRIFSIIPAYGFCAYMMFIVFKFVQELEIIVNSSGSASAAINLDCVNVT